MAWAYFAIHFPAFVAIFFVFPFRLATGQYKKEFPLQSGLKNKH